MNREEVFERIRAHLAEELEVDAGKIGDDTRFKEDLNADSLHLVELTVELEDIYGVQIPDADAARLVTVGQAADYIAAHAPQNAS
jgi:acyl carrier protein